MWTVPDLLIQLILLFCIYPKSCYFT